MQDSVSVSVLQAHVYSIKWYHDFSLCTNPCDSKMITLLLEGAKRILSKPVSKKEPITPFHLRKIVDLFGTDLNNLQNLRICAMFLIGFAGFLRYSEISHLKMCNLSTFDSYIVLFIECSKTDIYRRGKKVIVSINLAGLSFGSDEYIFRSVRFFKSNNCYKLVTINRPLSYTRHEQFC